MSHVRWSRFRSRTHPVAGFAPLVGFLVGLAVLVWVTPVGGPLYEPALLPSRIPLEVAGADPLIAVASVGMGLNRLYVTGISALLFAGAVGAAFVGSREGALAGLLLGGGAAGTLVRVSGCHCGAGSATQLWQLGI